MNKLQKNDLDSLLRNALRRSAGEPPADFARVTADLLADAPERANMEILATWLLVALGVVGAGAYAVFATEAIASQLNELLERAPWPLLLTAAAVMAAIKLTDCITAWRQARDPMRV